MEKYRKLHNFQNFLKFEVSNKKKKILDQVSKSHF